MAYQMIHMEIAYRLLKRIPQISNAAEFILGSVAPDCVHMNPDYNVNMKVRTHMFEGCGQWGDTQDYQLWKRNINSFYEIMRKIFSKHHYIWLWKKKMLKLFDY